MKEKISGIIKQLEAVKADLDSMASEQVPIVSPEAWYVAQNIGSAIKDLSKLNSNI